jgi:hypothetical protein
MRTLFYLFTGLISLVSTTHAAKEILLRLQPVADAPVIAKITASEKVILDAPPAHRLTRRRKQILQRDDLLE